MPSFGEKLKQEREKRKVTLEEISASTKIGTRMLQALEEEKFNQLPGGIFNKGFVRAYARFVGLDEDQTVADYLEASGEGAPPAPEEEERFPIPEEQAKRSRDRRYQGDDSIRIMEASADSGAGSLPWGWLAAILLIVALGLLLWYRRREEPQAATKPAAAPVAAAAAHAAEGNHGGAAGQESGPKTPAAVAAPAGSGAAAPKAIPVGAAPSHTPAQRVAAVTPRGETVAGQFTVTIRAREDCWISATSDGKLHSSELLTSGHERAIQGQNRVTVKVGNAGAVDLLWNGTRQQTGGTFGDVRTITFGPGGMISDAAQAPANP